jgi:hypothetical protein
MQCQWNPASAVQWSAFHAERLGSLQQSWQYGEVMRANGIEVQRAWLHDAHGIAGLAQFA